MLGEGVNLASYAAVLAGVYLTPFAPWWPADARGSTTGFAYEPRPAASQSSQPSTAVRKRSPAGSIKLR